MLFFELITLAEVVPGTSVTSEGVVIALISAAVTFFASFMTMKGKTQDTANWLVSQIRAQLESTMLANEECRSLRAQDRIQIDKLRAENAGLEAALRTQAYDLEKAEAKIAMLEEEITHGGPDSV